ncbi:hypothetical protein BGP77_05090 [Saccharospirillum sp. MSK14-1]|uniref:DUF2835 domain-containing protein n=1 Tax=Saccharospirillum sp. MSK14-1 TaxID=1897632 RepID=UPI000D363385|nr:DUF2835 domain-containing protein [Saccharospirillum sp. MSK14-1]PTY37315.1 hypothetical protein BGP77_05090 [Saccharospirillum sp. MSK14-1]
MSQTLIVDLYISADDYLRHYQGSVKSVSCESRDGRRVQFPSGILQRFVTRNGVRGSFSLEVDDNFKLIGIRRIA